MNRLLKKYREEVSTELMKKFSYSSPMMIPKVEKVVINQSIASGETDSKLFETAAAEIAAITGQTPVKTVAKKSLASFKLREGQTMGCKVTLRGEKMYEFLDKLFNVSLGRIRDFRGISPKSFDGHGNYALGIKEQIIFPEIDYDKIKKLLGMDIIIVTSAKTDEEGKALLEMMGCPFKS